MLYIHRPSQPKTLPIVAVSGGQHKGAPVNHMIMPAAHSSDGVTWPAADYLHQVRRPGWLRRREGAAGRAGDQHRVFLKRSNKRVEEEELEES